MNRVGSRKGAKLWVSLEPLFHPGYVLFITTLLSFIAWVFPSFGYFRKGLIGGYYSVSTSGIFVMIFWFLLLGVASYMSFKVGSRVFHRIDIADKYAPLSSKFAYYTLSVLGFIGVAYVLLNILSNLSFKDIISLLQNGKANDLKAILYDSYRIGFASLRYITILSSAMAIYHLRNKRYILLSTVNLLSLIFVATISSRLAFICSIYTAGMIMFVSNKQKTRLIHLVLIVTLLFVLLCVFNWTRNKNFYEFIGIDNWIDAGFSEIIAYLGSAFQGFLAVVSLGNQVESIDFSLLPNLIKVSPELTTNSALLQLTVASGMPYAFLLTFVCLFFAGLLVSFAYKNKSNYFLLVAGPLMYSFAEMWRIFLFNQGIIITLVIISLLVPSITIFLSRLRFRYRKIEVTK